MPNSDPIEFDPNLTIPMGLKHSSYIERNEVDTPVVDDDIDDEDANSEETIEDDSGGTEDSTDDEELEVPSFMEIVEQIVRTAPDGTQVVDVVLNIEDVEGAVKYDVRITK